MLKTAGGNTLSCGKWGDSSKDLKRERKQIRRREQIGNGCLTKSTTETFNEPSIVPPYGQTDRRRIGGKLDRLGETAEESPPTKLAISCKVRERRGRLR